MPPAASDDLTRQQSRYLGDNLPLPDDPNKISTENDLGGKTKKKSKSGSKAKAKAAKAAAKSPPEDLYVSPPLLGRSVVNRHTTGLTPRPLHKSSHLRVPTRPWSHNHPRLSCRRFWMLSVPSARLQRTISPIEPIAGPNPSPLGRAHPKMSVKGICRVDLLLVTSQPLRKEALAIRLPHHRRLERDHLATEMDTRAAPFPDSSQ